METRQVFWQRDYPLTEDELAFFQQVKDSIFTHIAFLLSKESNMTKMKCYTSYGLEIANAEPIYQNLHFHKAMALYFHILPMIEHVLGRSQPANRQGRRDFVTQMRHAVLFTKKNFPYYDSGFRSKTNKIVASVCEFIDLEKFPGLGEMKELHTPRYRRSNFYRKFLKDTPFLLELGHFAIKNNIPLLDNKLFYRVLFDKLDHSVEEQREVKEEPKEESKKEIRSFGKN